MTPHGHDMTMEDEAGHSQDPESYTEEKGSCGKSLLRDLALAIARLPRAHPASQTVAGRAFLTFNFLHRTAPHF